MTLLIPDARRGLLGGLIDDACLLGPHPPGLSTAVERYRALRAGEGGWILGRLLVPASLLEDLAGVLIRTMTSGEGPWGLGVITGDDPARDASISASFHLAMDPAASIDIVYLPGSSSHREPSRERTYEHIAASLAAARGVQQGAVPMLSVRVDDRAESFVEAVARARSSTLLPAGVCVTIDDLPDAPSLTGTLTECVRSGLSLTIGPASVPAVTVVDPLAGVSGYGALNLLAAALSVSASAGPDVVAMLVDGRPSAFSLGFTGLAWRNAIVGPKVMSDSSERPLVSIGSLDPGATISAICEVVSIC